MRGSILALALAARALAACQRAKPPGACVAPGDALVARALLDQGRGALGHADAGSSIVSLEAGLARIGQPDLAAPTLPLDDTGMKIAAVRSQGDPRRLASLESRVLAERLADYDRYCGR